MVAATHSETIARTITCNCGRWLAEVTIVLGHRQRNRYRRCTHCHARKRPAYPVVFIREDGLYCVVNWPCPIDAESLPWPERGWR